MDSIKLSKRLIVKEDINFDADGSGGKVSIVHADGSTAEGHLVNASHVPLTIDARIKTGAANVDDALLLLDTKVTNISSQSVLDNSLVVTINSTDPPDDIQKTINNIDKNLGGHTVVFEFPEEYSWSLLTSLVWSGFYNGSIIIRGGTGTLFTNGKALGQLFLLLDCHCRLTIQNISFTHTANTLFAIKAERCTSVEVIDCNFTGVANTTYALCLRLSNGNFSGGSFVNEAKVFVDGALGTGGGTTVVNRERKLFDIFPSTKFVEDGACRLDVDNILTGCLSDKSKYHEFYQEAVALKKAGKIPIKTNAQFDSDISTYGQCGAFVIDEIAGSIRLPKLNSFIQIGTPGTLHKAGLPNITGGVLDRAGYSEDMKGAFYVSELSEWRCRDWGSTDGFGDVSFDASRANPIYGASPTVQPKSAELRFFMQVTPISGQSGSGDEVGPNIILSISDVLDIMDKRGFIASGGVVNGDVDIHGSLTVRSGATVSGGFLATASSGGLTTQLLQTASGAIVRQVSSSVNVTTLPPWSIAAGAITYFNSVVPLSGSVIYDTATSQWVDSIPGMNHLECSINSSTGLITAYFFTNEGGDAGLDMYGFDISGTGVISASGALTSDYDGTIVSGGVYTAYISAAGQVSSSVTVTSKEHDLLGRFENLSSQGVFSSGGIATNIVQPIASDAASSAVSYVSGGLQTQINTVSGGLQSQINALSSGGGTQSGAIIENQPFSTTVGWYTVELTSGGLAITNPDTAISARITNGGVYLDVVGGSAYIDDISMIFKNVYGQELAIRESDITANSSAITQVSSAFSGTSLGIAELEGGVKYVCQSALTALSIGSAAAGCNAAFYFQIASGGIITPPANVPLFGEAPTSTGVTYCLAINGDMAVCAPAIVEAQ